MLKTKLSFYLSKNKKWLQIIIFVILLLFILLVLWPSCIYVQYLNLDSGNIVTNYYFNAIKLYSKEEKSELTFYMKNHIFNGDIHYLPLLSKKGFFKEDFRNHHCFYELKMYFMECDLEGREISDEKINEIINKYLKE